MLLIFEFLKLEQTFKIRLLTYESLKRVIKHKVGVFINRNSEFLLAKMELNLQVCYLNELNQKYLFKCFDQIQTKVP